MKTIRHAGREYIKTGRNAGIPTVALNDHITIQSSNPRTITALTRAPIDKSKRAAA
jgi:hypothetical protein